MRFLILLGCCLLFSCEVNATEVRYPRPRVFSSEDGDSSVKVVPRNLGANKWTTTATLFDLNPNGSEHKLADWTLVNMPMRVLFASDSSDFVVTWGSWMNLPSDPLIVIYNRSGRLLHQLKKDELFAPTDRDGMRLSTSVNTWGDEAKFSFETPMIYTETKGARTTYRRGVSQPEKTRLNIAFESGKKISIELATGKVENAA